MSPFPLAIIRETSGRWCLTPPSRLGPLHVPRQAVIKGSRPFMTERLSRTLHCAFAITSMTLTTHGGHRDCDAGVATTRGAQARFVNQPQAPINPRCKSSRRSENASAGETLAALFERFSASRRGHKGVTPLYDRTALLNAPLRFRYNADDVDNSRRAPRLRRKRSPLQEARKRALLTNRKLPPIRGVNRRGVAKTRRRARRWRRCLRGFQRRGVVGRVFTRLLTG
ncbi:MAG: hypothetical protein QOF78_4453 [Phycisphaerales bacterium]|nr:hypothetical protein [Phycisphaerales bacterium]